jgi:hypothetical protein
MIQLTRHGWALLGFTFWCIGVMLDYPWNIGFFFLFGTCFGKAMFGKFDKK